MKTISAIKNYIFCTCAFFTFFEFMIYIIGAQVTTFNDAITFATAGVILLFSALVAATNYIFKIQSLKAPLRLIIHFASLGICFFALFSLVGTISVNDGIGDIFVMFVVYTILYALVAGFIFGIGHALRLIGNKISDKAKSTPSKSKKKSEKGKSEEYKSLFSK